MFVFLLVIGVTAITLQLTVHKVWERTLREQIERNLKQKTLMFAYRVEADRSTLWPILPLRRARRLEPAPPSSIRPARCWPILRPIPAQWRISVTVRNLLPPSAAKLEWMKAAVNLLLWAFPSC